MSKHETIGLMMVREGLISRPQLYEGMRKQRQTGRLIGDCLIGLGFISPTQLLETLSRQLSIPALPSGTIATASPEAAALLSAESARALGAVPLSLKGNCLTLAVSNSENLARLAKTPEFEHYELGVYLALESEIDSAITRFYPETALQKPASSQAPSRIEKRPASALIKQELRTQNYPNRTEAKARILRQNTIPNHVVPLPQDSADGPIPVELKSKPLFDSIEKLYEAQTINNIGRRAGQGLGQFFSRIAVARLSSSTFFLIGYGGWQPQKIALPLRSIPAVQSSASTPSLIYGAPQDDHRVTEIIQLFNAAAPLAALIVVVDTLRGAPLIFYGDNGADPRIYDDLHILELLFKEVETALGMLNI